MFTGIGTPVAGLKGGLAGLVTEGDMGVAYMKTEVLLDFQRVRV